MNTTIQRLDRRVRIVAAHVLHSVRSVLEHLLKIMVYRLKHPRFIEAGR